MVKPLVVLGSLAVLVAILAVLAKVAVILTGSFVVISFVPAKMRYILNKKVQEIVFAGL